MKESKFTPGPWIVTDATTGHDLPHRWIADCYQLSIVTQESGNIPNHEQAEANARLIAAAPELLAACKAALERLSFAAPEVQPASRPALFIDQSTYKQLRAAIAKAEKEAE